MILLAPSDLPVLCDLCGELFQMRIPASGQRKGRCVGYGFTLVEVLVAVALVGSVMTVLLLARLEAVRQAERAHELTRATRLAQQITVRMDLPDFDLDELDQQLGHHPTAGLRWEVVPAEPPLDWPADSRSLIWRIRIFRAQRRHDQPLVDVTYVPRQRFLIDDS